MERRHDSIRRFNEISLKLDSFRLLHSLANGFGDSVWEEYYVDTINHYWGIVQKERAAQEKKVIIVREQK